MRSLSMLSLVLVGATLLAPMTQAKEHIVKMGDAKGKLVYEPKELTIAKGDTVKWEFVKAGPHNVVFDTKKVPAGTDPVKLSHKKLLSKTDPKMITKFDVAGEYNYNCTPHKAAGMVAKIIVK